MTSLKKRSKLHLKNIQRAAETLIWLSNDIEVLHPVLLPAEILLHASTDLLKTLKKTEKWHVIEHINDSEAYQTLIELGEIDLISLVEDQLFAEQASLNDTATDRFFQQLLSKIEQLYGSALNDIQQLTSIISG